jgi:hypothetical protein
MTAQNNHMRVAIKTSIPNASDLEIVQFVSRN